MSDHPNGLTDNQAEIYRLHRVEGLSLREIARQKGRAFSGVHAAFLRAEKRMALDPYVAEGLADYGVENLDGVSGGWLIKKDGEGGRLSLQFRTKDNEQQSFADLVRDSLADYKPLDRKLYAPRVNLGAAGEHLLVVDLADVHFGKLCTAGETGHKYNVEIARHRAVEGTRALLQGASGYGVGRVLFVMGNDILHTDNGKTTTSGTPQDTDGTFFTAWRAAQHATIDAINECADVAETDLLHCMSNHDWRSGWALSQTIAAEYRGNTRVRATDYNLSEIHRKFYGYERNAFMFTHGDGTKEEKLYGHFATEARHLLSTCTNLYAFLHHVHHKIAKRRGVDVFQGEKDHNGMTAIMTGAPRPEGVHLNIEYVRSPSPPDGWHDRNGYTNRQGVEAFMHHPHEGQKVRLTEWF